MDRPEGGACLHPSAILQSRVPGADGPSTQVKGTLQGGHSGPAAMPILMEYRVHKARVMCPRSPRPLLDHSLGAWLNSFDWLPGLHWPVR